jgi:hypothetical protein
MDMISTNSCGREFAISPYIKKEWKFVIYTFENK